MRSGLAVVFAAAMGGLLGGGAVGILEAIYLLVSAAEVTDYQVLPYGALLYGGAGCALGLGVALPIHLGSLIVRRPMRPAWGWAVAWTVSFCAMGLVVSLWLLRREVYEGALPPSSVQGGVAAIFGLIGLVALIVGSGLIGRTMLKAVATPVGGLAVYGGTVVFLLLMHVGSGHMGEVTLPGRAIPDHLVQRPNVVLIVADSLRVDHLGCYGGAGELTPALDAFAEDAVVYEQAVAQAPGTRSSMTSILTGMYPSSHGICGPADRLAEEVDTLAEVLSGAGYVTGARVNHPNLLRRFNHHQGFDDHVYLRPKLPFHAKDSSSFLVLYGALRRRFAEGMVEGARRVERYYRGGEDVTAAGSLFMQAHVGERFFLLLHYMEPHEPYFRHPLDGHAVARDADVDPDPERAGEIGELYAGEVAHLDEQLRLLFRYMREEGLWEESLVIVTADHGEELGDHGGWWSGQALYEELIRVPLMVKYPAGYGYADGTEVVEVAGDVAAEEAVAEPVLRPVTVTAGSRVASQIRSIDIAPTIVSLAGEPAPESWQGVTITSPWDARDAVDKLAYSEAGCGARAATSLRTTSWKLIQAPPGSARPLPECALFDLSVDPDERENRCGEDDIDDHRRALQEQMTAIKATTRGHAASPTEAGMDRATCRRLQEMGYVNLSVDCDAL